VGVAARPRSGDARPFVKLKEPPAMVVAVHRYGEFGHVPASAMPGRPGTTARPLDAMLLDMVAVRVPVAKETL
jgi:hypothetical protein